MTKRENVAYVLRCSDGTLYTGWTNNIEKRLKAHNAGKGGKYTRVRIPVELVYLEEFGTKQEAMSREAQIKRLTRKEKEALIAEKPGKKRRSNDKMYQVLLADDDDKERARLKKLIEQSGQPFQVTGEVQHGIAALQAVRERAPDLMIADVKLPRLDGVELAQKMMELELEVQMILLSGSAEYEYARAAMRYSVAGCLLRPVEQRRLNEIFQRFVQEKKSEEKTEPLQGQPQETVLERLFDELEKSYMEDITLKGLAEKYNISASRLSVKAKEKFGMSFSKYLTHKRIEKAKDMLRESKYSIEQIAGMVGYSDYFYFTKVFKKIVGESPSQYRKDLET